MEYLDDHAPRRSAASNAAWRAQRNRLKRKARRRFLALILGVVLVGVFSGLFTAYFGARSPAAGVTSSTTPAAAATSPKEQAAIDPVVQARSVRANEMGQVLVLMYHLIGYDDSQYNRTPEGFRQDIADLKAAGYYPINLRDLVNGDFDVPAGKSPVVITFDDSSGGQYRISPDGSLDPDCAIAILQEAARQGAMGEPGELLPSSRRRRPRSCPFRPA